MKPLLRPWRHSFCGLMMQSGQIWTQMRQIWDIFRSDFSTFWLAELKSIEIWSEKVPDLSNLILGPNLVTILMKEDLPIYAAISVTQWTRGWFLMAWRHTPSCHVVVVRFVVELPANDKVALFDTSAAQWGMVSRSKMADPHVLVARETTNTLRVLRTKPHLTWEEIIVLNTESSWRSAGIHTMLNNI